VTYLFFFFFDGASNVGDAPVTDHPRKVRHLGLGLGLTYIPTPVSAGA